MDAHPSDAIKGPHVDRWLTGRPLLRRMRKHSWPAEVQIPLPSATGKVPLDAHVSYPLFLPTGTHPPAGQESQIPLTDGRQGSQGRSPIPQAPHPLSGPHPFSPMPPDLPTDTISIHLPTTSHSAQMYNPPALQAGRTGGRRVLLHPPTAPPGQLQTGHVFPLKRGPAICQFQKEELCASAGNIARFSRLKRWMALRPSVARRDQSQLECEYEQQEAEDPLFDRAQACPVGILWQRETLRERSTSTGHFPLQGKTAYADAPARQRPARTHCRPGYPGAARPGLSASQNVARSSTGAG